MEYFDYILKNGNAFVGNSIQSEIDIGIKKNKSKQIVIDKKNKKYEFDYVVFACHTDQA